MGNCICSYCNMLILREGIISSMTSKICLFDLQKTRKVLAEKIEQLNAAIDDVSAQLRSEEATNGVAINSDEIEAATWDCCDLIVYNVPLLCSLKNLLLVQNVFWFYCNIFLFLLNNKLTGFLLMTAATVGKYAFMADFLCSISHLFILKSFHDGHGTGATLVVLWSDLLIIQVWWLF